MERPARLAINLICMWVTKGAGLPNALGFKGTLAPFTGPVRSGSSWLDLCVPFWRGNVTWMSFVVVILLWKEEYGNQV